MICEHAEILPQPCAGTVYSRQIKCAAGQGNTCLRNCGAKCPAYKPAQTKPKPPVNPRQAGGSYAPKPYVPAQNVPSRTGTTSAVQAALNRNRSIGTVSADTPAPRKPGCGTCGKARTK